MTVWEDILAELTAESITKFIGEPGQSNINNLESELAKNATKIKTTEDMVEKRHKYGFIVVVLKKLKTEQSLVGPGGCDETIQEIFIW